MSEVLVTSSATPSSNPAAHSTGRNLVLYCDGTSNQFGSNNTNVVRLAQVMLRHPDKQRLYYDPGVGTLPEPGFRGKIASAWSIVRGLAFGAGLSENVVEAYTYLMNYWERGDRVFLFGFSRGAYTVRVLAGMLHAVGLLPRGSENMVPYAMRLFKAVRGVDRKDEGGKGSDYWDLCDQFRKTFARPIVDDDEHRRFDVHFMGLWDTVSSVGWVWDPVHYQFTHRNPSVHAIRHAISIDERRWFFRQNVMSPPRPPTDPTERRIDQSLVQLWFAGSHCDIGGGYPYDPNKKLPERDSRIWRNALDWMIAEAKDAGLLLNKERLAEIVPPIPSDATPQPAVDDPKESLEWYWWPAEFFPKFPYIRGCGHRLAWGLGRWRRLPPGAQLHRSSLLRIAAGRYAPPNLSPQFITDVRAAGYTADSAPMSREHVGEVTSPKVAPELCPPEA